MGADLREIRVEAARHAEASRQKDIKVRAHR